MDSLIDRRRLAAELGESGRPRFLLVTHRVPFPPDKGDRIRSYHLLAHLAARGVVDLASLSDAPVNSTTRAALGRLCRRVEMVPVHGLGRWVRAGLSLARGRSLTAGLFGSARFGTLVGHWLRTNRYDAVVCFSSGVLPFVLNRGIEDRLVVDLVDVDSRKWLDYAQRATGPASLLFRLESRRVRALERAAGQARAVVLATRPEATLYRAFCPEGNLEVVANGVDLAYFQPTPGPVAEVGCVFVGQLDYRANILSLEWFCAEVWPLIRQRIPAATLRLVGRNPTAAVRRLGSRPGVELIGTVADVRPHLAAARIVVVPLLVARGVQNKVLEAMAMGRAVIASPGALEGLTLRPDRDVLVADAPADWERQVARLWDDPAQRDTLGRAARLHVEREHQWETTLQPFDAYLNLAPSAPPPAASADVVGL